MSSSRSNKKLFGLVQDHQRFGTSSSNRFGFKDTSVLQSTWSGICPSTSSSKRVGIRIGRSLHSILEVTI